MQSFFAVLCVANLSTGALADDPANLTPVPFTAVKFEDEFWAPRIRTTIEKTIPACFDQCEQTGRIANWDKAARKEGKFEGYFFNDSDVYKVMEAAAYAIKLDPSATYKGRKLDEYVDELIAKIAAMQQPDGYVNSYFVLTGEPKWTDIEHKHELYCAGHLIEAAVAHYECTGKRNLLDIALKLADHICDTFGPAPGKNPNPCGHPEIEMALIKLAILCNGSIATEWISCILNFGSADYARNTIPVGATLSPDRARASRYFQLAQFFVAQHGRKEGREKLWGEYALDDVPLCSRREIAGHAVRGMYFFAAATDLARLNGDVSGWESHTSPCPHGYRPALDEIWRDLTERKMYITGGIGSSASNEGFTAAYDLPNETAYAETCASIGLVFWAHRMNLLHADAKYFDVLERALYNNVLAAISLDGTQFNYVNPLASRGQHRRQPWHACACCPPNLARLFPTIGGYMYAQDEKSIYVNLYAQSTATFQHGDANVTIRQETRYPWDGKAELKVSVDRPCKLVLWLRIPGWCTNPELFIGGDLAKDVAPIKGYMGVYCSLERDNSYVINFPMPVARIYCDPRAKANVGKLALQRGPLVYCIERVDNRESVCELWAGDEPDFEAQPKGTENSLLALRPSSLGAVHRPTFLDGITVISGDACRQLEPASETGLYTRGPVSAVTKFAAIPYFVWNNRDAGDMIVWIPESPAFLDPQPVAWLKPSASHCWNRDTVAALHDRLEPADSSDAGIPRFTWWPKKGDEQWVQYDFDKPRRVRAVEVYWFDDARKGAGCKPPATWRVQVRASDAWSDVNSASPYGTADDQFNRVTFEPAETTGVRVVATLAEGFSAGILEWKVEAD